MRIGLFTDSLQHLDLEAVLATCEELGIGEVEVGTGNYSPAPHCDLVDLLGDRQTREAWLAGFERRGMVLGALNCSGNPLHPDPTRARSHDRVIRDTLRLAGALGIRKIVTMSGCPGAPGGSSHPHWAAGAWLPDYRGVFRWQWEERILPYWHDLAAFAREQGVERVCLELHPGMAVYNPHTLHALRAAVGSTVCANLDPSHLFWQGMDPLVVAPLLGDAIGHVHAKDNLLDRANIASNGVLDARWMGDPKEMPWYFCTLGYGHDAGFWKAFALKLLACGYDGALSIEHEDPLLPPLDAVQKTVRFLAEILPAREARPLARPSARG